MAISMGGALLGGAALGLLGSKGTKQGTTTTTQNAEPWKPVQPYLLDLFQRGQAASNTPFSGPRLAPGATDVMGDTIRGDYLTPNSNPFLANYVNDALGLVKSNFAGQYGGQAGSNLGNSGYQEMLTRTLANTALPIYANAYNSERQNQLNAAQLAPSMDAANMQIPFAPLQAYASLLNGNFGGTTKTQQPYFTNPIASAMGGALGGGMLFKMLGGG